MLFVYGPNDDATIYAFSKGCCEVNRTVEEAVCGGLSNLRKYAGLNIVKTNIPLRFQENSIIFYFNCWFMPSDSKIHWKKPLGHCACAKNNCGI